MEDGIISIAFADHPLRQPGSFVGPESMSHFAPGKFENRSRVGISFLNAMAFGSMARL